MSVIYFEKVALFISYTVSPDLLSRCKKFTQLPENVSQDLVWQFCVVLVKETLSPVYVYSLLRYNEYIQFEDDYNLNFDTAFSIKYLQFSNVFADSSSFVATVHCITKNNIYICIIIYATETHILH
jgi:hypothetical protein